MAPEIFESKPYSIKADVYSFAVNKLNINIKDCYVGDMCQRNTL